MTPQKRICFTDVTCSLARCAGTNCLWTECIATRPEMNSMSKQGQQAVAVLNSQINHVLPARLSSASIGMRSPGKVFCRTCNQLLHMRSDPHDKVGVSVVACLLAGLVATIATESMTGPQRVQILLQVRARKRLPADCLQLGGANWPMLRGRTCVLSCQRLLRQLLVSPRQSCSWRHGQVHTQYIICLRPVTFPKTFSWEQLCCTSQSS